MITPISGRCCWYRAVVYNGLIYTFNGMYKAGSLTRGFKTCECQSWQGSYPSIQLGEGCWAGIFNGKIFAVGRNS